MRSLLLAVLLSTASAGSFASASSAALLDAQRAALKKVPETARLALARLAGDPLLPWARGWALLADANAPALSLEQEAKSNEGSLMARKLREQAAWQRLLAQENDKALADLAPYSESDLSAFGRCALWSASGKWPEDPSSVERALASSSGAPPCVRLSALSANRPERRDALLAGLARAPGATRKALLEGIARSPATDAQGSALGAQISAPGSALARAIGARADLSLAASIPPGLPRLRQAAWSLAAQGAFSRSQTSALDSIPESELDKDGAWALFRLALLAQDEARLKSILARLQKIDGDNSRLLFWSALMNDPQGKAAQTLLTRNNYHAFVLRAALNKPFFALSSEPARKAAASCSSYAQTAPILLAKAGASGESMQAWAFALSQAGEPERRCMARSARAAGAYALAINARARLPATDDQDLAAQWEIGEKEAIYAASNARGLPPELFGALARQESRYDARAISAVGAMGLSQLMPATAAEMARAEGIGSPDLFNASINASLGARYFKDKLSRLGDARWALSAYNAGEGRARAWRSSFGALPWVTAVELIPFEETRGYVEKVYEGWAAHAQIATSSGERVLAGASASAERFLQGSARGASKLPKNSD